MANMMTDAQKWAQDWINQQQNQGQDNFTNPVGSSNYTVFGTGGSARHTGNFSSENPYFKQLQLANNNADKDALYERAIEWEADYSNLTEQRDYAREVLEEQRAYDDPSAVVARQRAAGINPDLAGGSAGSSGSAGSAQQVQPQMADQSAQSNFSNKYDNIALVQNGLQTAASVISSFASFGSSVINSLVSLKKLPSEINLANASASASTAAAEATKQLTPVQVAAGHLTNLNNAISLFDKASQIISPDTSFEDAQSIFNSIGIPSEHHKGLYDSTQAYHKNPAMRNYFARNQREAIANEEYNNVYTNEVVNGMLELGKEINDATLAFDKDISLLKVGITKLLDMNKLSTDIASATQTGAQVSAEQVELQRKQVHRDISAFVSNLGDLKDAEERSLKLIDDIKSNAIKRAGKDINGNPKPYKLSPAEDALIELEQQRIKQYRSLGSMVLSELYSLMSQTTLNDYYRDENLDPQGNLEPTPGIQKHQLFLRYAWSDFVTGRVSSDKLTKSLIGRLPVVGPVVNDIFEPLP